jgi:hypothetical protein
MYCPFTSTTENDQAFLLDSLMSKLLQGDKKPSPMAARILCSILLYSGDSRLQRLTISSLLCSGLKRLMDSPQLLLADSQSR